MNTRITSAAPTPTLGWNWKTFPAVLGPGIVVMLADTDVGSVVTAAQSGAQWGYKLLLLQFILMPILYIVQELTVEVMNSCLLPMVLGFLVALAMKALPLEHRLRGWYFWGVVAISTLSAGLGVYGGLTSIPGW